jgi:leucyl aminopeptidase
MPTPNLTDAPAGAASPEAALPLLLLAEAELAPWLEAAEETARAWIAATGFRAKPGELCLLPGAEGRPARALAGIDRDDPLWSLAALAASLPALDYRLEGPLEPPAATQAALGWSLGAYRFERYRSEPRKPARLVWPEGTDRAAVERATAAIFLARDLINTPASDMGPAELAAAARAVAAHEGAAIEIIEGEALLARNYPLIHAVGRASTRAPRLIDLRWGAEDALKVTLVGKGVCFDSGGLDLKTAAGMLMMKKDMGGAAITLALAQMIMQAKLPVRLRLLIPAVENSVSGDAMRPLDIVKSRKGLTVEIGNTDAEGRLILADALAEAATEKPALLIDVSTLTGAARVALGTELPALFSNDDQLAADLLRCGEAVGDPLWRLPLWRPYRKMLDSKTADINNAPESGYAGAITAALFLERFVEPGIPWAHLDLMAWNLKGRPGKPEGGAAMALRALYALIAERAAVG